MAAAESGLVVARAVVTGTFFGPYGLVFTGLGRCGVTSIERTAYPRFKRFLSARELHVFYTPQPEEIAWARGQARSDEHLLALMVQAKCFSRLGYFPRLEDVPEVVVGHIRRDLGLGEDVARCTTPTGPGARTGR